MKERIAKLLAVKSIVTIALTFVFCLMTVRGMVSSDQFLTIFTVVIGFYFGTQHERKQEAKTTAEAAVVTEEKAV